MALIGPKSDRAIAWRPTVPLSITRGSDDSLIITFVHSQDCTRLLPRSDACSNGTAATGPIAPFRLNYYYYFPVTSARLLRALSSRGISRVQAIRPLAVLSRPHQALRACLVIAGLVRRRGGAPEMKTARRGARVQDCGRQYRLPWADHEQQTPRRPAGLHIMQKALPRRASAHGRRVWV